MLSSQLKLNLSYYSDLYDRICILHDRTDAFARLNGHGAL